ncbi:MAG TPA: restriction endonuclease subunit S [Pyrinomonadaceae bacterium]|nr:restriction endonuclease subunit S [Pyrinomonadaceae bacterium]
MEVKPGYKQTEMGVIPEEWNLDYVENIAQIGTGSRNTQDRVEDGEYPFFVRSQNVERINSYSFDGEAVLTAGDGVGTGKVFHYINGRFDVHQRVYRISNFSDCLNGYFFYLYFSTHFYNRIMQMTAKSSVDSVRREMIARMPVPLPPTLAEQRAIAEALSGVAALLDGLDRLIAKKRDLKQAAMQQLLTRQNRLPGFHDEWEVRKLSEVCTKIQDGTHFSPKLGGNDYLYVTSKNIGAGTLDLSTADTIDAEEHDKIYRRCDVRKGDLLLTKDGVNTGNCALNPLDEPFSLLSSVAFLRFDMKRDSPKFFLYQILSMEGQRQIADLMSGNAITRLTLAKIKTLQFAVASFDEQAAIAGVLSDMDAEIAALEQRRDKTRALKQAMMQELLTGKMRLV